jgi:phospholipid/cholesterol/gamma-HCH transport system substrate-binding protein
MTPARGAAAGALVLVVVILAVLVLGPGSSVKYKLVFTNAGQLVKGNEVQVGGTKVGQVQAIDLTEGNQASITIKVDGDFAPLHRGTTALIRATSLSGQANRYISLSPGPNNAPKLPDGATLATDRTKSIVDLDQLFNTLDPKTTKALQQVIQGSAAQYKGVEAQANLAAHYFNPALSTTARLTNELNRDTGTFTQFLLETSRTMTALASKRQTLTDLVTNTNTTASAIAAESTSFSRGLELLPPTLRRANSTFVDLRLALVDLTKLVDVSKPATVNLARFLADLRPLVHDSIPTVRDLRLTIRQPGPNNDLINLLQKTPKLGQQAKVVFPRAVKTLKKAQPVVEFIRPYIPELVGWFRDFGQGTSNYDANGNFARIQPIVNTFSFNDQTNALTPVLEGNRLAENLGLDTLNLTRCPGADGNLDCNPTQVPPGP